MVAVISGLQGLVLPVHFLAIDEPELLGFVFSGARIGGLVGGATWTPPPVPGGRGGRGLVSLAAMLSGFVTIGLLPAVAAVFVGAASSGPLPDGWGAHGRHHVGRIPEACGRMMVRDALITAAPRLGIVVVALMNAPSTSPSPASAQPFRGGHGDRGGARALVT